jgi:predicted RecA/RadA family phage recombinase
MANDFAAQLYHGDPLMVDHTPSSAVAAGELVQLGGMVCIAHNPIAADELGALAYPGGNAVYKMKMNADSVFTAGAKVYADLTAQDVDDDAAVATDGMVGYAVAAADETAGDTHVYVIHDYDVDT